MSDPINGLEVVAYVRKEHHHDGLFVSFAKDHVYRVGDEPLVRLRDVKEALATPPKPTLTDNPFTTAFGTL